MERTYFSFKGASKINQKCVPALEYYVAVKKNNKHQYMQNKAIFKAGYMMC